MNTTICGFGVVIEHLCKPRNATNTYISIILGLLVDYWDFSIIFHIKINVWPPQQCL